LSLAVGVGHIVRALSASINVPPSLALLGVTSPPLVPSVLVGVGHIIPGFQPVWATSKKLWGPWLLLP
jgi:hypothetical protein